MGQLDGKWWPQFRSSTTQTKFLNRPGCTVLEAIRLKVALQAPVYALYSVVVTRTQTSLQLSSLYCDSHSFLSLGSSEIETRLCTTYSNWCILQPRNTDPFFCYRFLCRQYTLAWSLLSVTCTLHHACYRNLKNRKQF